MSFFFQILFSFCFFWPHLAACRILLLKPGIQPASPAVKVGVLPTGPPQQAHVSFI